MIVLTTVLARLKARFFSNLFCIIMLIWNGKWKIGEKLGSKPRSCYIQIRVITDRAVARCRCIRQKSLDHEIWVTVTYNDFEVKVASH